MLHEHFITAASTYTAPQKAEMLWQEIEYCYHEHNRHYHTLDHLNNVLSELLPHQQAFTNWHTIIFAIAYHDAIYNPLKNNNEEKSASFAGKRLAEINFPEPEQGRCLKLIQATKKHEPADAETNLFTDADLSILGAEPEVYMLYTQQIRREYSVYPDFLYNPGRKKVLEHFLALASIYKTESFQSLYETRAKANLNHELEVLMQ